MLRKYTSKSTHNIEHQARSTKHFIVNEKKNAYNTIKYTYIYYDYIQKDSLS